MIHWLTSLGMLSAALHTAVQAVACSTGLSLRSSTRNGTLLLSRTLSSRVDTAPPLHRAERAAAPARARRKRLPSACAARRVPRGHASGAQAEPFTTGRAASLARFTGPIIRPGGQRVQCCRHSLPQAGAGAILFRQTRLLRIAINAPGTSGSPVPREVASGRDLPATGRWG